MKKFEVVTLVNGDHAITVRVGTEQEKHWLELGYEVGEVEKPASTPKAKSDKPKKRAGRRKVSEVKDDSAD